MYTYIYIYTYDPAPPHKILENTLLLNITPTFVYVLEGVNMSIADMKLTKST